MACSNFENLILGNTSWWLLLYILEALVFQDTSKWILSSLSNRAVFFSEYFNLKNYQKKKTRTFILISMMRGNTIIAFHHVFMIAFTASLSKNFSLLTKLKDFDFFKATFSINHYIHKTYLHKKFIYIRITKTKKYIFWEVYRRTWFCWIVYTS